MFDVNANGLRDTCGTNATRVLMAFLENMPAKIDNWQIPILQMLLQNLDRAKTTALRLLIIQVVCSSLFYNAQATIDYMETNGLIQKVFTIWYESLTHFKKVFERKRLVLAIDRILELPQTPQLIADGFKQFVTTLSEQVAKISEAREDEKKEAEEGEKSFNADDDDNYDDLPDDDSVDSDGVEEVMKNLRKYDEDGDELNTDDEEEYAWDVPTEEMYDSPLTNIDELSLTKQLIQTFSTEQPQKYAAILEALGEEGAQKFSTNLDHGIQLFTEIQAIREKANN
eukprot:CAMPEP_0114975124 /NCGR_PEP_ID=MMETSP0216-20121206/1913_1 /TAXON_ID=223996 /ORGANISM="Protocruzia adherens, Strain Boccale" /LENGTH=283 /DNA_ID=CAMNT_0002335847 /DNA_START=112 /DNA_END=963 /DNA_ORIENTATION=-